MEVIAQIANIVIFVSVITSLVLNFRLDSLWGGINALQIISFLSYGNVAWPANISFLFEGVNKITQFDFLDPFAQIESSGKYLIDWKWSPTDSKGSSLVR